MPIFLSSAEPLIDNTSLPSICRIFSIFISCPISTFHLNKPVKSFNNVPRQGRSTVSLFVAMSEGTARRTRLRFCETRAVQCDYRVSYRKAQTTCSPPCSEAGPPVGRWSVGRSVAGNDDTSSGRVGSSAHRRPSSCRPSDTPRAL